MLVYLYCKYNTFMLYLYFIIKLIILKMLIGSCEFKLVFHFFFKMIHNISMLWNTVWWYKTITFIKKFKFSQLGFIEMKVYLYYNYNIFLSYLYFIIKVIILEITFYASLILNIKTLKILRRFSHSLYPSSYSSCPFQFCFNFFLG